MQHCKYFVYIMKLNLIFISQLLYVYLMCGKTDAMQSVLCCTVCFNSGLHFFSIHHCYL